MGIFDGLFGNSSGAVTPSQNPLIDPQGIRQQAAVQGLQALFAGLMSAGQKRPVSQPGPGLGDAFGAFSPAYQRGIQSGRLDQQMQRQAQQEQQMQTYIAGRPELAGLPAPIAQQVVAAQLSRPPPDPRHNFMPGYRGQLWDVSSGTPRLVQGQAGAGGADGSGGGGTAGAFRGTGLDAQSWNVLTNPQSDPASPLYAAAWSNLTQPRMTPVPIDANDPTRGMMMAEVTPQMPPNLRRPTHMGGAPAPTQPSPNARQPTITMTGQGELPPGMPAAPAAAARAVPIAGTERPPPVTDQQRLISGFATRMDTTEGIMGGLERSGYNPANPTDAIATRTGFAGNYALSAQGQSYWNAAQNWVRANLRRESGAVIQPQEMADEIRIYFPQPGDTPETIAQKASLRRTTRDALVTGAGGAYRGRPDATAPPPPPPPSGPPQPAPMTSPAPRFTSGPRVNQIDRSRLRDGAIYNLGDGRPVRWDASANDFIIVNRRDR